MADLTQASPSQAGSGDGLATQGSGFTDTAPAGSVGPTTPARELPASTAPSGGTPAAPADAQPVNWQKRYEDTQSAYTKAQQTLAELGDVGTAKQRLQFVEGLTRDASFMKWASERLAAQQTGQEKVDPETMKALSIVDQRSQMAALQVVAPILVPMLKKQAEDHKNAVFSEMTKRHPEWEQFKPQMQKLQESLEERGLDGRAFDFDHMENLYNTVRMRDPNYVASEYQRTLAAKQANVTTASPGTAPSAVGQPKAGSVREAYQQALRQHGRA